MVALQSDDQTICKCGDCGGLWVDVGDTNRLLLHHNLPGIEALGGKLDAESLSGQCTECQVDLVRVNGGDKRHALHYDSCENCGGLFLESEFLDASDFAIAQAEIVDFFRAFSGKRQMKKLAATA